MDDLHGHGRASSSVLKPKMVLLTVGMSPERFPQLIRILQEHEVTRLIDVREGRAYRRVMSDRMN
jgi:hypothetical protein